ncbi:hypothetical protein A5320_19845 [Rheinheimera sp. SA_1]|uniref:hypothetical protein n=1 Tax=Rheinheimera sp. SA_1 TaxID=1827365 RepID=UPI0007FD7676|nr:hypothetical protein [Rheinheimera sp. SA_1]OBP13107.1 hypothetical protein A5320_19845 [Rheinheimera sp. SA_1]
MRFQSCVAQAKTAQYRSFLRTGLKALDAALALVALEQPKLPNAALPQVLLSPAEIRIFKLFGYIFPVKNSQKPAEV